MSFCFKPTRYLGFKHGSTVHRVCCRSSLPLLPFALNFCDFKKRLIWTSGIISGLDLKKTVATSGLPSRWSCVTRPKDTMKASFWGRNNSFMAGVWMQPLQEPRNSTSGFSSFLGRGGRGGGGGDKGGVDEEGMVTTAFCSAPFPGLTVC